MMSGILTVLAVIPALISPLQATIDGARLDQGRKQYELVQQNSQLPKYGQCWVNAMVSIETGCRQLNDVIQTRMALAYLNCFLEVQGRSAYTCNEELELKSCVQNMTDADRSSFATFFTHTQDICYFLQAQVWQEQTEHTINRLEVSSSQVAEQLEDSHKLQQDILSSQSSSLENQKKLLNQAQNLSDTISTSSKTVHSLFADLKQSTVEQKQIIGDLFDMLSRLQTTILGEVSGFYSLFYYVVSVFICYLLTSTTRTSGARIWLFVIVTINVVMEQTAVKWFSQVVFASGGDDIRLEHQYWLQRQVRWFFMVLALCVLIVCAYMYRDINVINNKLLVEIRKQNSDILRFFTGNFEAFTGQTKGQQDSDSADSDYTSDNMEYDHSDDDDSDKTFILSENHEASDIDSCKTDDLGEADHVSVLNELYELQKERESTGEGIQSWLNNSFDMDGSKNTITSSHLATPSTPYNLRPRTGGQTTKVSPAARVESPKSFSRTVRQMQEITEKNSRLIRAYQQQNWQSGQRTESNYNSSRVVEHSSAPRIPNGNDLDRSSIVTRSSRFSLKK